MITKTEIKNVLDVVVFTNIEKIYTNDLNNIDFEKLVFNKCAIVVNNIITNTSQYNYSLNFLTHNVELVLLNKTKFEIYEDINKIINKFTNNKINANIVYTSVENIGEYAQYNDRILYKKINLKILESLSIN